MNRKTREIRKTPRTHNTTLCEFLLLVFPVCEGDHNTWLALFAITVLHPHELGTEMGWDRFQLDSGFKNFLKKSCLAHQGAGKGKKQKEGVRKSFSRGMPSTRYKSSKHQKERGEEEGLRRAWIRSAHAELSSANPGLWDCLPVTVYQFHGTEPHWFFSLI
jgi:hypothetical protein